jgi:hypothetical protein
MKSDSGTLIQAINRSAPVQPTNTPNGPASAGRGRSSIDQRERGRESNALV